MPIYMDNFREHVLINFILKSRDKYHTNGGWHSTSSSTLFKIIF